MLINKVIGINAKDGIGGRDKLQELGRNVAGMMNGISILRLVQHY